jgi:hypothetical protein
MRSHTVNRRDLKAAKDRRGKWLIAGCLLLTLGGGVGLALTQPPTRHGATGCLPTPAAAHTTTIVDRTDPWLPPDRALLRAAIVQLVDSTPVESRLTLMTFDGGATSLPEPLFDKCRPKDGRDVNMLISSPAKADRVFATTFSQPAVATIDKLTDVVTNAKETHLVAFLATVGGAIAYQSTAQRRRIRLYSDMAEHTLEGSSVSKSRLKFTPQNFTTYFRERVGDRLKGIELEIVVTPSATTPPAVARQIKAAWTAALTQAGITYIWGSL